MSEIDTFQRPYPTCPHCGYSLDVDDMNSVSNDDLWGATPKEERTIVKCPQCDIEYWVQGGYVPYYTSAFAEEDL